MNKKEIIKIAAIGIIIIFACVFAFQECARNKDDNPISNVEIKKRTVNEVVLSMSSVQTLNPLISVDEDVFYINKLIYSSLFTFDENMTPQADLVEKYQFSGKELTITLKNAKWHDGKGVSAEDVSFTLDAIETIGSNGPYFQKANKIKKITGKGDTVTVEFRSADDMSLSYLSFPIIPEHLYKNTREYAKDIESFEAVGSGMYKLNSYDKTKALKLAINEDFYGTKAKSTVRIDIIKPGDHKVNMVEASNITVLLEKSANRVTKVNKKGIEIKDFIANQVDFIGFNFKSEFMKEKALRQVVAYMVDRGTILEEDYFNSAVETDSLYIPGYLNSKAVTDEYDYDLKKAQGILEENKFKDTNDDKILENSSGKKMSLKIIVDESKTERVEVAQRIKEELSKIGIEARLEAVTASVYIATLKSGNFDLYVGGMVTDETMDFRNLLGTGGQDNYIGYTDKKADEYLDSMMQGKTIDEMAKKLVEFKKYLNEELPYYCIGYRTYGIVEAPSFKGTLNPTYNNPYRGIETWFSEFEERIVEENATDQPPTEE